MPAPAVYVLAIVGTVGAVLAFKEFVYEPHIAPAIDRWYIEYQAARQRRQRQTAVLAVAHDLDDDVPMSQMTKEARKARQSQVKSTSSNDTDTSSSDDEASSSGVYGNRFMKRGLLLRRPPEQRGYERLPGSPASSHQPVIELDDLVAREVREWRNSAGESSFPNQSLRQRKNANANVAGHAMDESIHTIPYAPLSPSRTHVVFDSSSSPVSTPSSSGSRASSPPLPPLPIGSPSHPAQPQPLAFSMTSDDANNQDPLSHPLTGSSAAVTSSPARDHETLAPITTTLPSPRFGSPFQQSIEQSPLFNNFPSSLTGSRQPTLPVPAADNVTYPAPSSSLASPQAVTPDGNSNPPPAALSPKPEADIGSSSIFSQTIPSLSQSYPQDLDYEHGLELLSPPSSRSLSPFSMAGLSPNLSIGAGSTNGLGIRTLSTSSVASSTFSSAMSSPALAAARSPLAMGFGNDSFDTVSPVGQTRQLDAASIPPTLNTDMSATNSARSTTYLSFDEDSASESASPIQYPRLSLQAMSQPASPSRATPRGSAFDGRNTGSLLFTNDSVTFSQTQTPAHEALLTPHASQVVSIGTSPLAAAGASLLVPPARSSSPHRSPEVDSLSDLDFLSESSPSEFEYAMSEPSDLGNESAGEGGPRSESGRSDAGSDDWSMPQASTSPRIAPRNEDNMATVRGRGRFGW